MAFFDDVSRMLNDVTSTAAEKTREFSEISNLNAIISNEEERFEGACTEIGKIYFENHKEDFEECYSHFMNMAKDAERKISESKKQLFIIKGVTVCEGCGQEVSLKVAFCSNCGKAVPKLEPVSDPNMIVCSRCGSGMPNTMKFCTQCGNALQACVAAAENTQPATVSHSNNNDQAEEQPTYRPSTEPMYQHDYSSGHSDSVFQFESLGNYQKSGYEQTDLVGNASDEYIASSHNDSGTDAYVNPFQSLEEPVTGFTGEDARVPDIGSYADNDIISSASVAMEQEDSALPMFEAGYGVPAGQNSFLDLYASESNTAAPCGEKICNVCGKKLSSDSVFCTECGSRV